MITHEWNGTVLTITSDSGTSSADLKGEKGIRGAQGEAGIILDTTGAVNLTPYATKEYVNEAIAKMPYCNATVLLDFSSFEQGYFIERLADGTEVTYVVTFDDAKNITSIGGISIVGV